MFVAAQENSAERGAQRQRVKCRKDNRGGDGDRKLLVNFSGNACHQAYRNKNR